MVLKLELYSRPGCHLCDEMVTEVKEALKDVAYQLEIINIDADPRLQRMYAARIPILLCNEQVLSEYHLDRQKLSSLLTGQKSSRN